MKRKLFVEEFNQERLHPAFATDVRVWSVPGYYGERLCYVPVETLEAAESRIRTLTDALTDLARFDIDPKYLCNGHDEVAQKARAALAAVQAD